MSYNTEHYHARLEALRLALQDRTDQRPIETAGKYYEFLSKGILPNLRDSNSPYTMPAPYITFTTPNTNTNG